MKKITSIILAILSAVAFAWAGAGTGVEQNIATYIQQLIAALIGGGSAVGAYKLMPSGGATPEARSASELANQISNDLADVGDAAGAKLAAELNSHIIQKQATARAKTPTI